MIQKSVPPETSVLEALKIAPSAKTVLNVGGGDRTFRLPAHYQGWRQILLDVDPKVQADILLDARSLTTLPPSLFDAVWCSHNLEHYHRHHGTEVLLGIHHVLKPDGFLEIRVPDMEEVMRHAVQHQLDLDDVIQQTSRGPVLVRDMIWGFNLEIEQLGNEFYAHKTGFTVKSLTQFVSAAGFPWCVTMRGNFEIAAGFFKQLPTEEQMTMLGVKLPT